MTSALPVAIPKAGQRGRDAPLERHDGRRWDGAPQGDTAARAPWRTAAGGGLPVPLDALSIQMEVFLSPPLFWSCICGETRLWLEEVAVPLLSREPMEVFW